MIWSAFQSELKKRKGNNGLLCSTKCQRARCSADPTWGYLHRPAGGRRTACLCQFPRATQAVGTSLGGLACAVPAGWRWGSTCSIWSPEGFRGRRKAGLTWAPGRLSSLQSLKEPQICHWWCLRWGEALGPLGSHLGGAEQCRFWEATSGLGYKSGSLAARAWWLWKVLVMKPRSGALRRMPFQHILLG